MKHIILFILITIVSAFAQYDTTTSGIGQQGYFYAGGGYSSVFNFSKGFHLDLGGNVINGLECGFIYEYQMHSDSVLSQVYSDGSESYTDASTDYSWIAGRVLVHPLGFSSENKTQHFSFYGGIEAGAMIIKSELYSYETYKTEETKITEGGFDWIAGIRVVPGDLLGLYVEGNNSQFRLGISF